MTVNEVELNTSILIPLADDMLEERKTAIDLINKKYGLNIEVDLSSVWKMQKEEVDKGYRNTRYRNRYRNDTKTDTDTNKLIQILIQKPIQKLIQIQTLIQILIKKGVNNVN